MIAVSDDFKTAVEAEIRQWKCRALMEFGSSLVSPPNVVCTSLEETFAGDYAVDGVLSTLGNIAFPGSRCYPSDVGEDDLLPADTGNGCGFWGDQFSDASGYLSQTLTLEWTTAQRLGQISLHFDEWLGYARDFEVSYYSAAWHVIATVTDNTSLTWAYMPANVIQATKLRVVVTRIQYPDENVRIIEFSAQWLEDISDRVNSWTVKKERYYTDASLPVPNASANSMDLVLDNSDHAFYRKNTESPYYGCLKANQRVWVYLSLLVNGVWEEVPVGVFYTTKWKSTRDSIETQVTLLDRAKRLMDSTYATSRVQKDKKISEMAIDILQDAGLGATEYVVDDTGEDSVIPYVWFDSMSHWNALARLAEAEGGKLWVDEYDRVIFENRERLTGGTVVATLEYNKHFGDANDDWDESQMRNHITVKATPYRIKPPEEEDIWTSQFSFWVPAGGYTNTSALWTASTGIRQPTLGSSAAEGISAQWYGDVTETSGTIRVKNSTSAAVEIKTGDLIVRGKPNKKKVWESGEDYLIVSNLDIKMFFNTVPCLEIADPELKGNLYSGVTVAWKTLPYAFGGTIRVTKTQGGNQTIKAGDLWVRAKELEPTGGIKVEKTDDALIAVYGKRGFEWENAFLQSKDLATDLAEFLLTTYKDPIGAVNLDMAVRGMPHLQLCDKVHVEDPVKLNLDADYWITGMSLTWNGALDGQLELIPA